MAAELTAGMTDNLEKVKTIYDYVVQNISYDRLLAAKVQSGYLPDIDQVLAKKKGICFDYAALMSAMLRSQEVPTKLVVGYTGSVYHAWINVYSEEEGWIDAAIYFDGQEWKLMDPTFASSNNSSQAIMKYIGNGPTIRRNTYIKIGCIGRVRLELCPPVRAWDDTQISLI